ncbi:MAG: hypothetical protein RIS76_3818 [Verrucomicrobiota bacterium]|jgi:uncharacterized lipoprotein YajG
MKLPSILSLAAAMVFVAGCSTAHKHSGGESAPAAAAASSAFDTSALISAFKNADLGSNQMVQSVVSALSSRDYSGALSSLQKLSRIPGLTASQSDAVQGLVSAVSAKAK